MRLERREVAERLRVNQRPEGLVAARDRQILRPARDQLQEAAGLLARVAPGLALGRYGCDGK